MGEVLYGQDLTEWETIYGALEWGSYGDDLIDQLESFWVETVSYTVMRDIERINGPLNEEE